MPRTKISEYSTTNSDNTDIESININEGCAPSGINNAIRELMVHLKEFQTGASSDPLTVAGTFVASGGATIAASAGTSASPSIHFSGDTNTGIFSPAADTIAFAEGGVEAMRINSSGNVGIGTTSPAARLHVASGADEPLSWGSTDAGFNYATIRGHSSGDLAYYGACGGAAITAGTSSDFGLRANQGAMLFATNGNNERMRITSDGEVLVGGTTAITTDRPAITLQSSPNSHPILNLFRNDTSVSSGNALGTIAFYGSDTTSNTPTQLAYIQAEASGTHAAGDNPTDLVFGTTPDGSATVTEAMRILNNGDAQINGATVGRGGSVVATNTAVGASALAANTTGANNTAVGYQALDANTTGIRNTAVGSNSLGANTTARYNTAVGYNSLTSNTTGEFNTAIGDAALSTSTTASYCTAVGQNALASNTTGADNIAVGYGALDANTTGVSNTAVGKDALGANAIGSNSTAVGHSALAVSTANNNTAIGYFTLAANTTGVNNVALGVNALLTNTTGIDNTAIGTFALDACTTGSENTAVGVNALTALTTGVNNTAVGSEAANEITTGTGNTIIGYNASASAATGVDQIVLGNGVTGQANTNVTIGNGTGKIYNAYTVNATWTQTSDERLKRNIQDDTLGLSFINRLRPVKYQWKPSNEIDQSLPYYNEENINRAGDVTLQAALDAEGVTTFAGWDMGEDTIQAISREMFVSPLIKAIQELSAKVTALEAQLSATTGRT